MGSKTFDRQARYTAFILLMLGINVVDGIVARSVAPGLRTTVAMAASFDVVLVVCALYYWMLVRPGIRGQGSLCAIAVVGLLHATYFFPNGMMAKAIVGGLCEVGLITYVVVQVRRSARRTDGGGTDPAAAIGTALSSVMAVPALTKFVTGELSILYYALFCWRAKPHVAQGTQAFSIYERVGQAALFGVLPLGCLLEMVPVHLVLKQWSPVGAWVATGLSLYAVVWLIGLARAFRLRPALVGEDSLVLRYGLLFQLRIPREAIAGVRRAETRDKGFAVPRRSEPTLCIEFTQPLEAEGLFGLRKRMDWVAVTPDEPAGFEQAVRALVERQ